MLAKYEQLTMKQTKAEMIRAYDELLKKLEAKAESGLPEKKVEQKKKAEKEVVAKASACTMESIVKDLADLHLNVGKALPAQGRFPLWVRLRLNRPRNRAPLNEMSVTLKTGAYRR